MRIPKANVGEIPIDLQSSRDFCHLRIVLAPEINSSMPRLYAGFNRLSQVFEFPDTFLEGRVNDSTSSFGSVAEVDFKRMWGHFLLKDIQTVEFGDAATEASQWLNSSFLLSMDTRATHLAPDEVTAPNPGDAAVPPTASGIANTRVTLICFGVPAELAARFEALLGSEEWKTIVEDPSLLLTFVYKSWYKQTDEIVWLASDRGSALERRVVKETTAAVYTARNSDVELEKLYRITKTVIHLLEGIDSTIASLEMARKSCSKAPPAGSRERRNEVVSELEYRAEMFRGTRFRLISLNERLKNVNNVWYHLAARRDNHLSQQINEQMKKENSRMMLFALIGVLFIPTSLVSSVFDAIYDRTNTTQETLINFGYLMSAAVPLTILTIFASQTWGKGLWLRRKGMPAAEGVEMEVIEVAP